MAATCAVTKPCRRNVPDERPLQPRNASHGGTSLTPRVPAAPCSGVADLVFVRLIIIIITWYEVLTVHTITQLAELGLFFYCYYTRYDKYQ